MADQRFGRSVTTRRAAASLTSATGRVACTTSANGWVWAARGVGLPDGAGAGVEGAARLGPAGALGLGLDTGSVAAGVQPVKTSRAAAYAPRPKT